MELSLPFENFNGNDGNESFSLPWYDKACTRMMFFPFFLRKLYRKNKKIGLDKHNTRREKLNFPMALSSKEIRNIFGSLKRYIFQIKNNWLPCSNLIEDQWPAIWKLLLFLHYAFVIRSYLINFTYIYHYYLLIWFQWF